VPADATHARRKEVSVTERHVPVPGKGSKGGSEAAEQEHLREDSGAGQDLGPGSGSGEHLREDAGIAGDRQQDDDRGLVEKAKDKLTGE